MKYVDEETFNSEIVNIEDDMLDIIKKIHNSIETYNLFFGVNLGTNNVEQEKCDRLYKIIISPLKKQ